MEQQTSNGPRRTRPATIYDVADRAGVSKSLVSLVLRGSPRVSEARRAAVNAAIAELDYRPSSAAVALAGTRTRTIGIMLDDFRNPWFVDLLSGLREALEGHGYRLVVADRFLNTGLDASPIEGFLSMRVEGIIVAGEPDIATRVPAGTPIVVAGGRSGGIAEADVVANDDVTGARMAVEHLIALGHRAIGHISAGTGAAVLRRDGYESALAAAGLTGGAGPTGGAGDPADLPVVDAGPLMTEESGRIAALDLLDAHPEVTAIFAANDVMALGALSALAERGLRVPEDVSVVGYDDTAIAAARYVDLTSVDDRSDELGRRAGHLLLARIADPRITPHETLVRPSVVVRGSTAAPRA